MQRNIENRKSGGGLKTDWSRTKPEERRKNQTPKATKKQITQVIQIPSQAISQTEGEQSKVNNPKTPQTSKSNPEGKS